MRHRELKKQRDVRNPTPRLRDRSERLRYPKRHRGNHRHYGKRKGEVAEAARDECNVNLADSLWPLMLTWCDDHGGPERWKGR